MSTEVMTTVVFGYNLPLNDEDQQSLENKGLKVFPVGQKGNFFLVGYEIMGTSSMGQIAEVEIGTIDLSKYEENLQEIMKLMNIEIESRAKFFLSNYYY